MYTIIQSVEENMTLEQYKNVTTKHKDTTISNSEQKKIRNSPLYKGQLSYLKEIILDDCPDIDADLLAEKLDVNFTTAQILLSDCHKKS